MLELVEVGGEVTDRIDQHQQSGHIAAEALAIEITRLNACSAEGQNGQDADDLNEPDHRVLEGHQAVGAVASQAVLVDLGLEALLQPGFRGEGPHQGQSFDGFGQQARQFADFVLTAFGGRHHPGAEQADQHRHQRRDQNDRHGEFPVQPGHVPEHGHQLQCTGDGVLDCLVDHFADPVRILGEAVGQIP